MELGNTVRAVRAAGEAGSPARALVRIVAAVLADARVVVGYDISAITMAFDRMGRRVTKGDRRFVYDGYLQVADSAGSAYVWDPTESAATRPLAWVRGGDAAYYTHDGSKNVSEVVAYDGTLAAHYGYAPFGAVTVRTGALASANPFRFFGEYADDALGLVYYNYRHYDPVTGRWLIRDPVQERGWAIVQQIQEVKNLRMFSNLYVFIANEPDGNTDIIGLGVCNCKDENICKEWCNQNITDGGFITGNHKCFTTYFGIVVKCQCAGWCENLIMSKAPRSIYEKWECTYRCGWKTAY